MMVADVYTRSGPCKQDSFVNRFVGGSVKIEGYIIIDNTIL